MRGRLLLLILALFLAAADAAFVAKPGLVGPTGEPATATTSPETSLGQPSEQGAGFAPDDDNQKLREKILNALRAHSSLASSNFNVEVSDSQIELSGSVPTAREKEISAPDCPVVRKQSQRSRREDRSTECRRSAGHAIVSALELVNL